MRRDPEAARLRFVLLVPTVSVCAGMTPAHSPPYYAGDGDMPSAKVLDSTWSKVVDVPPLSPHIPAFYSHGYKPAGASPDR